MQNIRNNFGWKALLTVFLIPAFSCNDNAIFEKEMYKNVVSLISSEDYNIFKEVVPLDQDSIVGYITASVGGTKPTTEDLKIYLEEDLDPLEFYNWSLFDADASQYAKLLPESKFHIEDMSITIPKGSRTGRRKVTISPRGLSPDSTYFIALKIDEEQTKSEANDEKNTLLYQVLIENDYASQDDQTLYKMSGYIDETRTAGNVLMLPIDGNKVRIMAGTEAFEAKQNVIEDGAVVLEIGEDNNITIVPYKNIEITQLYHPDYPNRYTREVDNFGRVYNTFLLSYEYMLPGGSKHIIQEELRLEVRDDD